MIAFNCYTIGFINMSDFSNEEWRVIPGRGGFYSVSSFGRVRSEDRKIIRSDGKKKTFKGILLSGSGGGKYYQTVVIAISGTKTTRYIHDLVTETFLGPKPKGKEVRHLDGNKHNNFVGNLCYGTKSENARDTVNHGNCSFTGKRFSQKIPEEEVIAICKAGRTGRAGADTLGRKYGVHPNTIWSIWRGKIWKELTEGIRPDKEVKKFDKLTESEKTLLLDRNNSDQYLCRQLCVTRSTLWQWRKKLIGDK